MKKLLTIVLLTCCSLGIVGQEVITQWTFDGTIEPSTGSGTAALVGGTTQHSATLASGWRITTFPDQETASGTAGASFMVSTVGFDNIILDFEQQASNTMSRWAEIQYTIDGGENWLVLENNNGGLAPGGSNYPFQFDFSSISGANNNADFGVRVVSIFSPVAFNPTVPDQEYDANTAYHRANATDYDGNAYAGTGNWRLLNVTFSGDPIIIKDIISQWTFDGTIEPSTGSGTAALVGGTTQHSATLASGWRITTFPDQETASGTAGASFMVSTVGFDNIILDFEQQASNTMSRWAEIQYTIDGGENWLVLENNNGGLAPGGSNYPFQFDFSSISGANNNADFGVRVVSIFSPVAFNPTVPDQEYDANTAYHRANATDYDGNAYAGTGNWRLLNVTFSGDALQGANAEKLAITSINDGEMIYFDVPFSLTIHSWDVDNLPAEVGVDTEVTLTLETGTGILGGTLSGTILEGSTSVTISGILYDTAEEGVSITASAAGLTPATTEPFEVLVVTYPLTLSVNIPGAGILTGAGSYEENQSVTVNAEANSGFAFISWTFDDESLASEDAEYTFDMPAEPLHLTANFELQAGESLIHYWHFNTLSGTVTEVGSDFSAVGTPLITYPGTGDGYMDERTHRTADPVSNLNLYMGQEPDQGAVLRVRNPSNTRELIIEAPSSGYENLYFTFATTRTDNGASEQELYYSTDGGTLWEIVGEAYEIPIVTEWVLKNFDLTGISEVNDNEELLFKVLFVGVGADNTSGNNRFDNISLTGSEIIGVGAESLSITSINEGSTVFVNQTFSLSVQARDGEGLAAAVDADTEVTLTLETGTGILGGTLSGTILEGTSSVTISGILYDTAEEGVSITASAAGLTPATTEPFEVLVVTYPLTLSVNIPGAGILTGAGSYEENQSVTVNAEANSGFAFISWTFDDESLASEDAEYTFDMPAEPLHLTANFELIPGGDIIHYWHFNDLPSGTLTSVDADFSIAGVATITYPGEGTGYMDRFDPGSDLNLLMDAVPGFALRLRNPADTREMIIAAPSTGYEGLFFTFAAHRSNNGAEQQEFYYSPDSGESWIQVGEAYDIQPIDPEYELFNFDLSAIEEIDNNPDLQFRILFIGANASGTSGNQRMDNISIRGNQITGGNAVNLAITSLNGGNIILVDTEFSITVQAQDDEELAAAVDADTEVTLTLETGTGILGGTLSGTILEGSTSVTISGILYDTAEEGVSITASAAGLTPATTEPFEVLVVTYPLTLSVNIPGAGILTGAGSYEENQSVTVNAEANSGFAFISWTFDDESLASEDAEYTFDMPAEPLHLTANFELIPGGDIIHYWHFNDLPSGTLTSVDADFSIVGVATITYPGEGTGYMDRFDPGSDLNLLMDAVPGFALRLRNPADTREMIIAAPSTGYEGLFFTFAAHRSNNGAEQQEFYYSPDSGESWIQVGEAYDIQPIDPEYELFNFDLSAIEEIDNNPDLQFRILFIGANASGTSGNQRMDNISIRGNQIIGGEAVSLAITSINEGNPIYVNQPFSLSIQARDNDELAAIVNADTEVTLSLETGNGILGGTLTGTILEGSTSVTISGILYDTAEEGVSITASTTGLTPATTEPFEVLVVTYPLTLVVNPSGAGVVTGEGNYEEDEEVTVTAEPNTNFVFINWTFDDESIASTNASYTFSMPSEALSLTANFEYQGEESLIHYWHFNTLSGVVTEVIADYSAIGTAVITYPGTGDGYMDERTHNDANPVSNLNLHMGQEPNQGAVLRVRNPSDTRELIFDAPSTGYENIEMAFATCRTENGAQEQEFYYSHDDGETWVKVGEAYSIPFIDVDGWILKTFDLSEVTELNNNENLKFRILFVGEGPSNPTGNNRFDNVSISGTQIFASDPVKLHIVSINNGQNPRANEPFNVVVRVLDENDIPAQVIDDVLVTISLATGSGNLGGNLTGYIIEATSEVTITGVTYDKAESEVSITASAEGLESFTSNAFTVLPPVGVEQPELNTLNVYPNPASSDVIITGVQKGSVIQIYSITGKLIMSEYALDELAKLDISKLVKGVYILKVQDISMHSRTTRVVIQ